MLLKVIAEALRSRGLLAGPVPAAETEISSIGCDSRAVRAGQLFFAKGVHFRREYLDEAVRRGAACYAAERDMGADCPLLLVSDIRKAMPAAAKVFYGDPASKYLIAGVTGTKGKTTVTHMLYNVLSLHYGRGRAGMISTNCALSGVRDVHKAGGSTPEALELYRILDEFAEDGLKAACIEVSSQALQYDRVDGVEFDVGAFINLGQDHISPTEHADFEEYKAAKERLLQASRVGVVNIDDPYAEQIMAAARCERIYTVSQTQKADYRAENIMLSRRGSSFTVNGRQYEVMMPGAFNVVNALVVIAMAEAMGCDARSIRLGVRGTSVAGRMEMYERDGVTVVVDYAHNEVSFEAVFDYLDEFYAGARKICLFGCQGNKALGRRTELPRVAGRRADLVILSTDDPENEAPMAIISQVAAQLDRTGVPYVCIEDREQAVKYAVDIAQPGDVVFLAGKGRETTQKVRGVSVPYKGDMPCAIEAFNRKGR